MDDIDRQILLFFQKEIPLKPKPFEILGKMAWIDSGELLLRVNRLQQEQVMGRISGIFDTEKMGYQSHWVAMQVAPEHIEQASYYISGHPGVVQCLRRKGSFNFWFVLMLPGSESLEFHTGRLKELAGAWNLLIFRTLEIYKPSGKASAAKREEPKAVFEELTALEKNLIRTIQEDFPLSDVPFQKIAKDLGSTEELVLKQLQFLQKRGCLKRIAAGKVSREKETANTLLLWNLPEEKINAAGKILAEFPEITFCARRTSFQELPYNLHVLVERVAEEQIPEIVDRIEKRIGMWPRQVLVKEKEEKRSRIKYFSKDIEEWRVQNADHAVSSL